MGVLSGDVWACGGWSGGGVMFGVGCARVAVWWCDGGVGCARVAVWWSDSGVVVGVWVC